MGDGAPELANDPVRGEAGARSIPRPDSLSQPTVQSSTSPTAGLSQYSVPVDEKSLLAT